MSATVTVQAGEEPVRVAKVFQYAEKVLERYAPIDLLPGETCTVTVLSYEALVVEVKP